MKLQDLTVVITGGSQGFGKGLAQAFLACGSKVIISSHDAIALEATAQELGCDFCLADVTSKAQLEALAAYTSEKYGAINIWINNAGIQIAPSSIEDVDPAKLRNLFDINFFGYFYGCQVALRHMKSRGQGAIINVNSTAGLEGKPQISAYSSSKFAIKGLTESLRKELKDSAIDVYGIFPGGMQTDIYKEKYPEDLDEYMQVDDVVAKVIENLQADTPEVDLVIKRPIK